MNLIQLSLLVCVTLAACAHAEDLVKVTAGPFEIQAPAAWVKTAIIEQVPLQPVYSAADWKEFKKDPMNILKPSYACRPQHWAIRFPALNLGGEPFDAKGARDNPTAPQILIHKAIEWEAAGENGEVKPASVAEYVKKLRDEMDKGVKERWYGDPAFMDAEFHFETGRKRIDFKGGHGFRMLAQWTIEADFVHSGALHYLFIGLSDDNTCQILATIPVDLSAVPGDEDQGKHLGYALRPYDKFTQDFDSYEKAVQRWLADNTSKVTPSLDKLDAMMASLHAETWK